jgi:hypothetical protein
MKKLNHYCVRVSTDTERNIVAKFYQLATKRPLNKFFPKTARTGVIGLDINRTVSMNTMGHHYSHEVSIPFTSLDYLADTPARVQALTKARNMFPTVIKPDFSHVTSVPEPETKKIPSKMLPVVTFRYPSSKTGKMERRYVRVVKADRQDLIGYELPDFDQQVEGTFKKFKRNRVEDGDVHLTHFNS